MGKQRCSRKAKMNESVQALPLLVLLVGMAIAQKNHDN
ncbi:hypothetical protein NSP_16960 [Nodularia spumigena CCY9414]|nr:hypothetical protein NSP_16960 [Nodularia spumigena CCY9414]